MLNDIVIKQSDSLVKESDEIKKTITIDEQAVTSADLLIKSSQINQSPCNRCANGHSNKKNAYTKKISAEIKNDDAMFFDMMDSMLFVGRDDIQRKSERDSLIVELAMQSLYIQFIQAQEDLGKRFPTLEDMRNYLKIKNKT